MKEDDGLEEKYCALKRRYNDLLATTADLVENLYLLKKQKKAWIKEKNFLLDIIIDMESAQKTQTEPVTPVTTTQTNLPTPSNNSTPTTLKKSKTPRGGGNSNSESNTQSAPNSKSNRRGRKKSNHKTSDESCMAQIQGRTCKSKSIVGLKYCRHHAAFDPESAYQFCEHVDRKGKQCQISVSKSASVKYCNSHKKKYAEKGIDLKGSVPSDALDDDLELNDNDDEEEDEDDFDDEENEEESHHHAFQEATPFDHMEDKFEDNKLTTLEPRTNVSIIPHPLKFSNTPKQIPTEHIKSETIQPKTTSSFQEVTPKFMNYMTSGSTTNTTGISIPQTTTNPNTPQSYDSVIFPQYLNQLSSLQTSYFPNYHMMQWNTPTKK